jgi:hypothetical protein
VTRFKELRRIEAAIEHKNKAELEWSISYCKMRLQISPRKQHKHWQQLERRIRDTMESVK